MQNSFEVTSGTIKVTDPCYELITWCTADIPAKCGTWNVDVLSADGRDSVLIAIHATALIKDSDWVLDETSIGVDSGQCGFYDLSYYENKYNSKETSEEFYDRVCNNHGIIDNSGVTCQSGYGDGGYNLYVVKNDQNEAIAIKVVFIGDEDYDDEQDGDE